MNMEKNTYQKSGTSVVFKKKKLIPDWCQLKTNKQDEQN